MGSRRSRGDPALPPRSGDAATALPLQVGGHAGDLDVDRLDGATDRLDVGRRRPLRRPEWNGGAGSYSIASWAIRAAPWPSSSASTDIPKSKPAVTPPR